MLTQHKVQVGDTVSGIAKRFGVPISAVSGFRSNNPNTIFPDEILNIDDGQAINIANNQADTGIVAQPSPLATTGPEIVDNALVAQNNPSSASPINTPPVIPPQTSQTPITSTVPKTPPVIQPQAGAVDEAGFASSTALPTGQFRTPSGAVIDKTGNVIQEQPEEKFFNQFGISTEAIGNGFQTNPFGTLSEIVAQVMQATGLPDSRQTITDITDQIEELENEKNKRISEIDDNPFVSASTKESRKNNLEKEYDSKINARVNKLTLLQSTQQEARQQAQFAATTAINLFGKQQEFQAQQVQDILDREEKRLEAEKLSSPVTEETLKSGTIVIRDGTGKVVSTLKPSVTSGTGNGFSSSVEGWANLLATGQATISNVPTNIRDKVVSYITTNDIDIKRQLDTASIKEITQTESALASLEDLRTVIQNNLQFVGPIAGLAKFNPWSDARKAQSDIDRVRQTVGKALEGGVLRKEDEEKYKKILATLGDTPSTALYKIDSLVSTLERDIQSYKENQLSAGRFVEGVDTNKTTLDPNALRAKYQY